MEPADAVPLPAQPQGERGHPRLLGDVVRVGPAELEEAVLVEAEAFGEVGVRGAEVGGGIRLVPRGDGRVRREDDAAARGLERVVERGAGRNLLRGELERGERGVALVHVDDGRLDPELAQRTHPADAEQPVLREADRAVALVQPARRPALDWSFAGTSASSRISGTRPTSTRQSWNASSAPKRFTVSTTADPSGA